ncbi:TetR/AcrR family transcriptional regulator [Sphingomonas sp. H39-1-10]|uniref:TetR/AcrR family transcriptional regulator n=1 Tax=Sphingomonas pollutisoli TaxID=3030829 RepID=UPI0023B9DD8F|nr:TetR/AcrR family transcriptional regulator [Sphingomonas pollutisoli]MDF0490352.1 TetR/AcrR family transcriptional regulator [Sphingomonas pollutisoli]
MAGRSRTSIGAVRSQEATDAILKAAAELLEEEGYSGFTLDAVARRAASSKPTIYRWWSSKGALIRDVYEHSGEASLRLPDTGNLGDDLTLHIKDLWRWWRESRAGEVFRSLLTELHLHPDLIVEFRGNFMERRSRILRTILQRAADRGEITDTKRMDAAIELLTGISWLHLLTASLDAEERVAAAASIVAAGLTSA